MPIIFFSTIAMRLTLNVTRKMSGAIPVTVVIRDGMYRRAECTHQRFIVREYSSFESLLCSLKEYFSKSRIGHKLDIHMRMLME